MPISELPQRNVSTVFAILDTNNDGSITRTDFESKAEQVTTLFALDGTETADEIQDGYLSWWDQLRTNCDRDDDGAVTKAEFVQAHASTDPDAFYQQQLSHLVAVVARAVDKDDDGYIDKAEYVRLFSVTGLSEETVHGGFEALDTDSDGRVSVEEFETAVAKLFLSANPTDPGTVLLGERG